MNSAGIGRPLRRPAMLILVVLALLTAREVAAKDNWKGILAYERGDYVVALDEFRASAKGGDAFAQYSLGRMYENGQGVDKDYGTALEWYATAAEKFHAGSLIKLARMHLLGRGVKASRVEAYKWYNIAQIRGSERAAKIMERMREKLTRAQLDAAQKLAINWLADRNERVRQSKSAGAGKPAGENADGDGESAEKKQ